MRILRFPDKKRLAFRYLVQVPKVLQRKSALKTRFSSNAFFSTVCKQFSAQSSKKCADISTLKACVTYVSIIKANYIRARIK